MFFITQDPALVRGLSSSSASTFVSFPTSTPELSNPFATKPATGPDDDGRDSRAKTLRAVTGMAAGITILVSALIICFLIMCTKPLQRGRPIASKGNGDGLGPHTYEPVAPQEMEVNPAELEVTLVEMEGTRMCSEMPVAAERRVRNEDLDELVS